MRVRRADGGVAPLGEVAEISRRARLLVIRRVGDRRAVTMHADVDPALASAGAVLRDIRSRTLPALREQFPGLRFEVAGPAGEVEETLEALRRNLRFALILTYALLAVPLSSWTQSFVIMAAVPFGLAGAVFGHITLGYSFPSRVSSAWRPSSALS